MARFMCYLETEHDMKTKTGKQTCKNKFVHKWKFTVEWKRELIGDQVHLKT